MSDRRLGAQSRAVLLAAACVLGAAACGTDAPVTSPASAPPARSAPMTTEATTAAATVAPTTTTTTITTTVAPTITTTGPPAEAAAGPVDAELLPGMILHLPDGPDGATVGDDGHCTSGGLSSDGYRDAFLDLVAEAAGVFETCFIQLEAPDTHVESLVISFPSEELARRAITPDVFAGVVRYYGLDCCNADPIGMLAAADGPGDQALSAVSGSDTSAVLGWRAGALIGAVSVLRLDGAVAEARRLADVQFERMLSPVVISDDIDDDRLIGLEQAPFTPWWVGETFAPPDFPPIRLTMSYFQEARVDVDYDGIHIQLFDLVEVTPGSESDQMLGVTAELFDSPCTVIKSIEGPGVSLLLGRHVPDEYLGLPPDGARTGWGELANDDCPAGEPNVWMATVEVDDLYIRVNPVMCYNCLTAPTPEHPYRTREGLRAVVAALARFDG